jgi:hypothetical protein
LARIGPIWIWAALLATILLTNWLSGALLAYSPLGVTFPFASFLREHPRDLPILTRARGGCQIYCMARCERSASQSIGVRLQIARTTKTPSTDLDSFACSLFVLWMVETLGEAHALGWRITARCACGSREGMKRIRDCSARYEVDLQTLIWTRGATFPVSMLAERLKCPRCGSRRIALMFNLPGQPVAKRSMP